MSTTYSQRLHTLSPISAISIREAGYADRAALIRLAQRDSARVPDGALLLAEIEGEIRAAVGIADGNLIADPFHRTAELAALLRTRARQLRDARRAPLRIAARTPVPERALREAA